VYAERQKNTKTRQNNADGPNFQASHRGRVLRLLAGRGEETRRFELDGDTYHHYHDSMLFLGTFTDSDWAKLMKLIEKDEDELHAIAAHLASTLGHDAKISVRFTSLGHSLTVSILQRTYVLGDEQGNGGRPEVERRAVHHMEDLGIVGTNSSIEDHYRRMLYAVRALRTIFPN